jgi:drug/metabolite transporter (DMT)-like permease
MAAGEIVDSRRPGNGAGVTALGWPLLAAGLWGGMYVVSRLAFSDVPPVTLGLLRLVVGLLALGGALRRLPPLADRRIVLLGVVLAATLMLQFWGTYLAGAAAGSLLTLTTPVFVALLAPVVLRERTHLKQWAGIVVGLFGAVLLTGLTTGRSAIGDLLLVASAFTWAAFTVLGAVAVRQRGALAVTAGASVWAVPLMIPGTLIELGRGLSVHLSPATVVEVLYLGLFATALAWWAWYRGVERLPAVSAAVVFLAQPMVGIALSIPIFGLPLGLPFVAGAILVAAGMLLAT